MEPHGAPWIGPKTPKYRRKRPIDRRQIFCLGDYHWRATRCFVSKHAGAHACICSYSNACLCFSIPFLEAVQNKGEVVVIGEWFNECCGCCCYVVFASDPHHIYLNIIDGNLSSTTGVFAFTVQQTPPNRFALCQPCPFSKT